MIVSIIIISVIFITLTLTACAMINKENADDENHCPGCPYRDICGKNKKEKKYLHFRN